MGETPGLVSVIVPFYNCERFLCETIESVLAQSYAKWELLLVDDGSTDGGSEIAREYAGRNTEQIFYLEHDGHGNCGVTRTRNLGAHHGSGEFLAFLDGDDVWLPEKLATQMQRLREVPDAGLLIGPSEYWYSWDVTQEEKDSVPAIAPGGKLYAPPELLKASHPIGEWGAPCPSSFLVRRSAFDAVGGFDEEFGRETYQLYEDTAFLTKMYLSTPVYVMSDHLDRYRCHRDSIWNRTKGTQREEAERRFYFKWLRGYLAEHPLTDEEAARAIRQKARPYWLGLPDVFTHLMRRAENRAKRKKLD